MDKYLEKEAGKSMQDMKAQTANTVVLHSYNGGLAANKKKESRDYRVETISSSVYDNSSSKMSTKPQMRSTSKKRDTSKGRNAAGRSSSTLAKTSGSIVNQNKNLYSMYANI